MLLPHDYRKGKKLETLVENKTTYSLNRAEMNIFETHDVAARVKLDFNQPVLATMIKGKKIMHLDNKDNFAFLPSESLLMPANKTMCIDFPEATWQNPTKCLTLTIEEQKIKEILQLLNEQNSKIDGQLWLLNDYNFHFANDAAIQQIIQRLIFLFAENHDAKDIFVEMMLKELLIRILQTESRHKLRQHSQEPNTSQRMAFVVNYIRQHLSDKISLRQLSQKAYMSESHLHRVFKTELGVSPVDFINEERLRLAANLLRDPHKKISDIYLQCGFNSLSYFNRVFKQRFALTPKAFQSQENMKYEV